MDDCATFILWDRRRGAALMEDRPDLHPDHPEHYWVYPGGKLEPGETPVAAMLRECLEETGVQVVRWEPLTGRFVSPVNGGWTIYPFVVTDWLGRVPARSREAHRPAPLAWRDPRAHAGKPDGHTCVVQIANAICRHWLEPGR